MARVNARPQTPLLQRHPARANRRKMVYNPTHAVDSCTAVYSTRLQGMSDTSSTTADSRIYVQDGSILIGISRQGREWSPETIELALANRHGLVTGATGTGKTVTLQVLAEGFSAAGVPVFAADIKGDLSGIAAIGTPKPHLVERAKEMGLEGHHGYTQFPVTFWDIFGDNGHPVRATVQEMGPLLLSRLLELTEPQEGVLNIAFRWAEDERIGGDSTMTILDLQDLRTVIDEMGKRAGQLSFSGAYSCWKSKARPSFSVNRHSISWTLSRPRLTVAAWSTFWQPRS
jgi:Bacterial protein of unknown function (DUF853)